MWPTIKAFLLDAATFKAAILVVVSMLAVAVASGDLDGFLPEQIIGIAKALAYPTVAMTALADKKKKKRG